MTKLPTCKPNEVIHKLRKAGFMFDRHAKGSHEIWYNPKTHRRTVIPNHPGKDIPKGSLAAIIKAAGFTIEEWNRL